MIDRYGWRAPLDQQFTPFAGRGLVPGRVAVQQRGLSIVVTEQGELQARPSGRLVRDAPEGGLPVAGDWVAVAARPAEGAGTIHAVLPRRTQFQRRAPDSPQAVQVVAANVDVTLLVLALTADFNLRRLERYLAAAWQSGARPVVVLTKSDLDPDPSAALAAAAAVAVGAPVLTVSALSGAGLADLAELLPPGDTAAVLGSSGAGKSTLVNALAGGDRMATAAVRADDQRGRHTTTHRELVLLPGGALLLDTPGMRELGLIDVDDGLDAAFDDIARLAGRCRFSDCRHDSEPGCAIREALDRGALDPARWRAFAKLQRELSRREHKDDRLARTAERRRWGAIAKANRARLKARDR